jgi:hypothetical protein
MHFATLLDSRAPAPPPSPTSGFGSVMGKEHNLQTSTEESLGTVEGPHSTSVDRILRNQQLRLDENVGLLEERYELLPHPARFRALQGKLPPLAKSVPDSTAPETTGALSRLVAQHIEVRENIATLIAHSPHGQQGELNLNEMAHNHEEMEWMLNALLKEDEWARDMIPTPITAGVTTERKASEASWENEGGATSAPLSPIPTRSDA